MKKIISKSLGFLFQFRFFLKITQIVQWEYIKFEAIKICKIISPELKILSGPFKDIKYPTLESAGSALLPKILGSYEDELQRIINDLIKKKYNLILDIGCAEGYYAVGFAKKLDDVKVIAYDNDKQALNLCIKMARYNNVEQKMTFEGFCSSDTLARFDFPVKSLIISDCEGYENELFNSENITNLSKSDILIELHNLVNPNIKEYLSKLFENSHSITTVSSKLKHVDDYPVLREIDKKYYNDRILVERDTRMEWLFLTHK